MEFLCSCFSACSPLPWSISEHFALLIGSSIFFWMTPVYFNWPLDYPQIQSQVWDCIWKRAVFRAEGFCLFCFAKGMD